MTVLCAIVYKCTLLQPATCMTCFCNYSGSTGGKQTVTLTGSGFDETIQVSICGQTCNKAYGASQTASQYICETPQAVGKYTELIVTDGRIPNI